MQDGGAGARAWLLPSATLPRLTIAPVIAIAYVTSLAAFGLLRPGNIGLASLALLDLYNERTRQFLRTFLPCIVTGAIYDSFRFALPPLIDGHIHVAGPYLLDRALFGVHGHTLPELFAHHHWVAADVLAGLAYLGYVVEYLTFAMVLFFSGDAARAHAFALGFLVVNLLGFATYVIYPAAPPWYVMQHGLGPAHVDAAPSAAAAVRFDALVGVHVFRDAYAHSVAVFGALPSLHVAYPALAAILIVRTRTLARARWGAAAYAVLVCFSAVYLQHHYVVDVLLGLAYAVITAQIVITWQARAARRAP